MYSTLLRVIKKSPIESVLIAVMILALCYAAMPASAFADVDTDPDMAYVALQIATIQNAFKSHGRLPIAGERGAVYTITVPATAYNSLPGQTDSTPSITASGTTTRHGVLAANFLPLGTRVKIPELYGDQVFVVEDRMNQRYWYMVDIWMESYADAIDFGVRNITLEIYPTS